MMDRHVSPQLAAYIDRQLSPQEALQVETHLKRCARCESEHEQIRSGMAMMEQLEIVQAPDMLWTSIEQALDRAEQPRPERRGLMIRWCLAAAAILICVVGAAYWQSTRQQKTQWEVVRLNGSPAVGSKPMGAQARVGAGEWIETDASSRVRIQVGNIGSVEVEPNTRVRIVTARPADHRLALARGEISAKILAPPRLFFVETPAGTAIDLGCEYTIHTDDNGLGLLRVTRGWVSFEWKGRDSLVPAGASCRTRPQIGPGTPYFDDASGAFVKALEDFDFENGGSSALTVILAESRARDTLTLWHLLLRVDPAERSRVFDRMATFSPLPSGVTRERVLNLDPETLNHWREELAWTW